MLRNVFAAQTKTSTIPKRKQFEKIEPKLKKLLDQQFESLQTAVDTAQIPRIEIELDSGEDED